jgi:hypothetical protein
MYEANDDEGRLIEQQDNFARYVDDERSELRVSHMTKYRITGSNRGPPRGFHLGEGGRKLTQRLCVIYVDFKIYNIKILS